MSEEASSMQLGFKYAAGGITSTVLFKGEKNQTTLFSMAAGTDIDEHTSTKEGYVYVIEGDGVFNLEGADIAMKPGVLIKMGKDAVHSLKAVGDTSFILFLNQV